MLKQDSPSFVGFPAAARYSLSQTWLWMGIMHTGSSSLGIPHWTQLCTDTHQTGTVWLGLTRIPAVMFTGMRTESRGGSGVLDAAALRQQRRLKQAIQFLHKDSADLLPLDGLKKLGTSKQGQPHHILQKRLLEAKLSQGRMNMCGVTQNSGGVLLSCTQFNSDGDEEDKEEDFIYVPCKCLGQQANVLIDTGCKLNLMSSQTVERFGLKELVEENKMETDGFPFQRKLCIDGLIKELSLTIGERRIMCSFAIVESNRPLMSLGNKTLKSLKCVIDTEKQMLVFGTNVREQVLFLKKPINESSSYDFSDL